jgi:archaellum component FlaC
MRASREPMTVRQLQRSMNARFKRVDRRFDRLEGRFDGLETRFDGLETRFDRLETRVDGLETQFDGIRSEIQHSEERLRRHFSVVVESIHDDVRILAEAIGLNSERLGDHEKRLRKLERLT